MSARLSIQTEICQKLLNRQLADVSILPAQVLLQRAANISCYHWKKKPISTGGTLRKCSTPELLTAPLRALDLWFKALPDDISVG